MVILEVEDIHTYYGDSYVLQGLSMALREGNILGLLGRNGVGKTTLVNSLVGFNPPRSGRITFKGIDITHTSSFVTVRMGMGLVPQGRRVFPTLSVEENLRVAERGNGRHGWNLGRVYQLFPQLAKRRRQRAKILSGGEQQMLAGDHREAQARRALDSVGGTKRRPGPKARGLRPCHQQGQGRLFLHPPRTLGQRRD
jgi:branched-chain amino acid transport system ATP-binding protein